MKNRSNISFATLILVASLLFTAVFLTYSTDASAQITPETQCYNQKLKASGKYVNCLLRAERQANRDGVEVSDEDVAQCHENFENRYSRAESRASEQGAECPSHGGLAPYQETIVGATRTINSNNDVKTLSVNINPEDLEYVSVRSLNLNIAIKVNGVFNVVWRSISSSNLALIQEFQWSPVFHVFGAEEIEGMDNPEIDIETNVVDIALGQDVVYGDDEILGKPVAGNNPNAIGFINNSGEIINPVIAQQLTVSGLTQAITSIYFDFSMGNTQVEMTPTQEVLIWFGDTNTGDIFLVEPSDLSTTVDMTNLSSLTLNFSDMQWSIVQSQ